MYFLSHDLDSLTLEQLLILSSVPNYCQSVSPKQTTLEEDRELFKNFSSILCLWFAIQGSRTDNFFGWVLNTVLSITQILRFWNKRPFLLNNTVTLGNGTKKISDRENCLSHPTLHSKASHPAYQTICLISALSACNFMLSKLSFVITLALFKTSVLRQWTFKAPMLQTDSV